MLTLAKYSNQITKTTAKAKAEGEGEGAGGRSNNSRIILEKVGKLMMPDMAEEFQSTRR